MDAQHKIPNSRRKTPSNRPAVLRYIHAIAFAIFDPTFRDSAEGVRLRRRVRDVFDFLDAIDLEAEMVDTAGRAGPFIYLSDGHMGYFSSI